MADETSFSVAVNHTNPLKWYLLSANLLSGKYLKTPFLNTSYLIIVSDMP